MKTDGYELEWLAQASRIGGERREVECQEFNRKLGIPVVFVPDPYDKRLGVGFWRAEPGGVVTYRKYANGYDPYSRYEYSAELIGILNRVSFILKAPNMDSDHDEQLKLRG